MCKSKCCDANIVPVKGYYMGQTFYVCCVCGKYVDKPEDEDG